MILQRLITTENLGLLAGFLTTIAFVPQVIKTWRSQSADDVSILMFILFIIGVFLWCVYGWEIHAKPVMIANIVTFILASLILGLKLKYEYFTEREKG